MSSNYSLPSPGLADFPDLQACVGTPSAPSNQELMKQLASVQMEASRRSNEIVDQLIKNERLEQRSKLENLLSDANGKIKQLEDKLREASTELDNKENQLVKLEKIHYEDAEKVQQLSNEISKLRTEKDGVVAEVANLKTLLQTQGNEILSLKADNDRIIKEKDEMHNRFIKEKEGMPVTQRDFRLLINEFANSRKETDNVDSMTAQLQAKIENLSSAIANMIKQSENWGDIEKLKAELQSKEAKVELLLEEKSNGWAVAKAQLDEAIAQIMALELANKSLTNDHSRGIGQLEEIQTKHTQAKRVILKLKSANATLETALEKANSDNLYDIENLKAELRSKNEKLALLETQLSEANLTIAVQLASIQANSTKSPARGTSKRNRPMQSTPLGTSSAENTPRRSTRRKSCSTPCR